MKNSSGGGDAAELIRDLDLDRKLVEFHLRQLVKYGLLENKYVLKDTEAEKRPFAKKEYTITTKGRKILEHILLIT
jgi:DNA-binding MarR family transcriptional regulator